MPAPPTGRSSTIETPSAGRRATAGALLRTLRPLLPTQLLHQALYRLRGPARVPAEVSAPGLVGLSSAADALAPSPEGRRVDGGVALLHTPPHEPREGGWTPAGRDALWSYTLHYHGWISTCPPEQARDDLLDWIARHDAGVGWEPYPTSMRALHWIGWLARGVAAPGHPASDPALRERLLASLAAQLRHLEAHVERHLLGNHLWTNLAALASAGLALDGPLARHLRRTAVPAFAAAVADQLGADGCHLERTPTYHCLLAEQLGGVVGLGARHRVARTTRVITRLEEAHARMLAALPAFTHADGDVALWGDSQRGAPVPPRALVPSLPRGHADAPDTGFYRRRWGPWTVLWNLGLVGMAHQVGHLHGDALALEVDLEDERVLVDAGVGTYSRGRERAYARATRAHNTVTVGACDQHELWASHRIGGRCRVEDVVAKGDTLEARALGFRASAWHRRTIRREGDHLVVRDALEPLPGRPLPPATARLFLPATCTITGRGDERTVTTPAGRRFLVRADPPLRLGDVEPGWRAINDPAPRRCLLAPVPARGLEWRLLPLRAHVDASASR
ncbi:MAG: heparinase II/III family protein [Nannocystaceae bacterium]|nr:heparinase II/III family protein [Myxococcales bacterium]